MRSSSLCSALRDDFFDQSFSQSLRSAPEYAEPNQTLIFIDWDDTLFPTDWVLNWLREKSRGNDRLELDTSCPYLPQLRREMVSYSEALINFLRTVCEFSTRCIILTLAQPNWVEYLVDLLFESSTKLAFNKLVDDGKVHIRYADPGRVRCIRGLKCLDYIRDCLGMYPDMLRRAKATRNKDAKKEVMKCEAMEFYSQYARQGWKNILSIGDSMYEYIACKELGTLYRDGRGDTPRVGRKARYLRSKVVRFQTNPGLQALTLQLRLMEKLIPMLVHFNGCLNLNIPDSLSRCQPLLNIAHCLRISPVQQLTSLTALSYIWDAYELGRRSRDPGFQRDVDTSLRQVELIVNEEVQRIVGMHRRFSTDAADLETPREANADTGGREGIWPESDIQAWYQGTCSLASETKDAVECERLIDLRWDEAQTHIPWEMHAELKQRLEGLKAGIAPMAVESQLQAYR